MMINSRLLHLSRFNYSIFQLRSLPSDDYSMDIVAKTSHADACLSRTDPSLGGPFPILTTSHRSTCDSRLVALVEAGDRIFFQAQPQSFGISFVGLEMPSLRR